MTSCWFLYMFEGAAQSRPSVASVECRFNSLLTNITILYITIAISNMTLGDKLRYLREMEGTLRGLERAMTQQEIVRAIREELGKTISQSYLSQIENGARPHLTNSTRMLLARFFKVHPGYLVDDPEGYSTELVLVSGVMDA